MILVDVFVPGAVKTKGSLVIRNRTTGAMKESVAGSSTWRALMAAAVRDDIARRHGANPMAPVVIPWSGPVAVSITAYLRSPCTCPRCVDRWPTWERAGDLDKIVRNVLDALGTHSKNPRMNGGAIVDDNLVCRLIAEKRISAPGEISTSPGVHIRVETL